MIRSAMPGEMYRLYDEYKRDEWERFLAYDDRMGHQDLSGLPAVAATSEQRRHICAELPASSIATARPTSARR